MRIILRAKDFVILIGLITLLVACSYSFLKIDVQKKRGKIIAYIDNSPIYSNETAKKINFLYNVEFKDLPEPNKRALLEQELTQELLFYIAQNQRWKADQLDSNNANKYIESSEGLTSVQNIKPIAWYKLLFLTKDKYNDLEKKSFLEQKNYVSAYTEFLISEYFIELKENAISNNPAYRSNKQLIKLIFKYENEKEYNQIYSQLLTQEKIFNKQLKFLTLKDIDKISFHEISEHLDNNFTFAVSPNQKNNKYSLEILIPLKYTDLLANDLFDNILLLKAKKMLKSYIKESSKRIKILI